jgi:hypothetical protein
MDGSKQPFISPQDLYGAIGTQRPFSSRRSGALAADNRVIVGAVRWPPYYIGLGHRNRPVEPAGQVLRAAFDRINVAQC